MLSLILSFRQGRYLLIQTECVSSHWDALRFAKAYEKNTRMCQNELNPESLLSNFRGFSSFRELGNATNGIFYSSQYWESRFSPIFCFPNVGKAVFRWFLLFPCEEKPIFANFWFSPARESRFSSIFVHRTPLRKPPFLVFCSSYPYESLLLPFFVHRTPTKASFSRFLLIVPRIWVIFRENRWFAPVSE